MQTLPEVADVLYFDSLTFTLPTGFHPSEIEAVDRLPRTLQQRSAAPPDMFWGLLGGYVAAGTSAMSAAKVLAPLRASVVRVVMPVYGRGFTELARAAELLNEPSVRSALMLTMPDVNLLGRETIGHYCFGLPSEIGADAALEALLADLRDESSLLDKAMTAVVNRLVHLSSFDAALVQDARWVPLLTAVSGSGAQGLQQPDGDQLLDFVSQRVFSEVLRPVFGVCDSLQKSTWVAAMRVARGEALDALRAMTRSLAMQLIALPASAPVAREELLRNSLRLEIRSPLEDLLDPAPFPWRDVIRDAGWDTAVVAGVMGLLVGGPPMAVATAAGVAGVASAGKRLFQSPPTPDPVAALLRDGLNAEAVDRYEAMRRLNAVSMRDVFPPWL